MAYVETFGGERIRLDLNIRSRDGLEERRLSNIGEASNDECAGIGVDRRETTQMLSDLLEVDEWVLETLADGCHATQRRSFQLLALEE